MSEYIKGKFSFLALFLTGHHIFLWPVWPFLWFQIDLPNSSCSLTAAFTACSLRMCWGKLTSIRRTTQLPLFPSPYSQESSRWPQEVEGIGGFKHLLLPMWLEQSAALPVLYSSLVAVGHHCSVPCRNTKSLAPGCLISLGEWGRLLSQVQVSCCWPVTRTQEPFWEP